MRALLWAGVISFAIALTLPARADEPPTAAVDVGAVVPPRLLTEPVLHYPDGAHGAATVTLGVTVAADGSVSGVRVIEGSEPFTSIARDAARGFRFEPARRDDRAIAATIRFEASFTEPAAPAPEVAEETPPEAAAARGEPSFEQVEVRGTRRKTPMVSSLGRAEVRQLPGAFGDPFRAIEVMPGVTPIISGLPYYYIRGAPPGNVGYYLDGIEVPYLFHFAAGPSVIHPAIVDEVDLYRGSYPGRFGRYAGGIVSAETTAPRATLFGESNIRLFDAGALVEAPFGKGDRWHALVGGRFSYTAALLSLVSPNTSVAYRDYQARVTYDLSPRERLSIFSFGAYDLAGGRENDRDVVFFASEFYRTDVRYDRALENGGTLRGATAFGFDRTRLEGSQFATALSVQPRVNAELPLGKNVRTRVGGDVLMKRYAADEANPFASDEQNQSFQRAFLAPRLDVMAGAYADLLLTLAPGIDVVPGLRFDLYQSKGDRALGVDPRVSSRSRLTRHLRLVTANAIAHQGPSFIVPVPAIGIAGLPGGLQRAFQSSVGIEADTPLASQTTVAVFRNHFLGVSDAIGASTGGDTNELLSRTNGYAYGGELSVKRKLTEKVSGLVSYTLSRSVRQTAFGWSPALFDRTHVLNVVLGFDLGRKWRFGGRTVFYTGRPNRSDLEAESIDELAERVRSPARTPSFFRLDVRLEKRWDLKRGWVSFIVEVLNTTLSREVMEVTCNTPGQCEEQKFGPLTIPSIGLEAGLP